MDLPQPASVRLRTSYRRRRVLWVVALTTILAIVFFAPSSFWESSGREHEEGGSSFVDSDRSNTPDPVLVKEPGGTVKDAPLLKEIELKNLLHMVVSSERTIPSDADTNRPLVLNAYAGDIDAAHWLAEMDTDPPLIVFSKTYCPYSKKAKELLSSLDISPLPKIVEVDLRDDADAIKSLLTRLTGHSTFPNVILSAKSLGGFDSLQVIRDEGRLIPMLEDKGLTVGNART